MNLVSPFRWPGQCVLPVYQLAYGAPPLLAAPNAGYVLTSLKHEKYMFPQVLHQVEVAERNNHRVLPVDQT